MEEYSQYTEVNAMSEDCRKKPLVGSVLLWRVAVVLLCPPVGFLVGTLLGLISDFGLSDTAENIRANPQIFANQYAGLIVNTGWTALVCLVAVVVIVGIQLWRSRVAG